MFFKGNQFMGPFRKNISPFFALSLVLTGCLQQTTVNSSKLLPLSPKASGANASPGNSPGNLFPSASPKPNPLPTPNPSPTPRPSPPAPPPSSGAAAAWGLPGAVMTTTVEFTTPEYTQADADDRRDLMSTNELTPVCHFKGSTYFVWTDTKRRTHVTKITKDISETFPLDPGTDYIRTTDGHGRYSLGIDLKGYLHITGDMHNYTERTVASYVPRYQKQTILYWKSKQPESVSGGFAFAGGRGAPTAIPGTGWTLGRFFTDNFGELFYVSRVKAIDGGNIPGEIGLGIYRYNINSSTWTALGGLPDPFGTSPRYKVVVWEVGGYAGKTTNPWFQGMVATVKFDKANRMHVATGINTDTSLAGNNRIVYAMSPDGGNTWTKANGQPIRSLPIRAVDGHPDVGDIVHDYGTQPVSKILTTALADKDGKPGVLLKEVWRVWNGSKWMVDTSMIASGKPGSESGNLAPNGSLLLTVPGYSTILHTLGFGKPAQSFWVGDYEAVIAIDEYGLRTTGDVYAVAITRESKRQLVLKITARAK